MALRTSLVIALFITCGFCSELAAQRRATSVELELIMQTGFRPEDSHTWLRALEDVGASGIRIRAARTGDEVGIKNVGTETSPRYKVYGMLTRDNRLVLQGATFRRSEIGGIRSYLEKLKTEGLEGLFAEKMAFGLTANQLVELHDDLSVRLVASTKDSQADELVAQIGRTLSARLDIDRGARRGFAEGDPVNEEYQGLSAGTSLAAILRPLGLVLVPIKEPNRDTRLVVMDARDADEHWPVGWPVEGAPLETAPKLFERLPVDIRNFTLEDALNAIQQRVDIPFIYDQNSIARHGIEMDQVQVEATGTLSYSQVIRQLLRQSRPTMNYELRTDERGQPFLWISTLR